MDVSGPILYPQDVSGLSQMSQNRILGQFFTMMRIEPPKCPSYTCPRGNHTAINIQRSVSNDTIFRAHCK
jgi:hypothetical protein